MTGLVVAAGTGAQAAPLSTAHTAASKAPAAKAFTPELGPGGRVIVLLKNHATSFTAHTDSQRLAARTARSDVSGLASRIRSSGGTVSHSYTLINGLSAQVSTAEARALAVDPAVQEVVPDVRIKAPAATANPAATVQPPTAPVTGACAANGGTQLEPEALEATRADSDVIGAKTARSLGYTGKGVTVGWIADGLDINNPDFQRNGKTIFSDYQDFSGDGVDAPTGGDEAYLDASAIAAQGNQTYDISTFSALPLSTACKIRIEGEAPGVDLVGLNIFGAGGGGYNSSFIQAIQYAATVDHVNVLNESLGSNGYPDDSASLDAVKAANDAAVALGVTVTASSGDAGVTSTIGSPATDPKVISVGASTTYRFYLQTGYGGGRLPGITGWVNDNISSLSSGGYTQDGRTVDLVAPGDLNWALCTADPKKYTECSDFTGKPSDVEEAGGTSESAPVTAGVAALVIEAFRAGHDGETPTPAVVKTILTSTADDIAAPAQQQGAGIVDAYKAVQLARSYKLATGAGDTLTAATSSFTAAGAPGSTHTFAETVTNSGSSAQTIRATTRTIGAYTRVRGATVTLSDAHSAKYVDFQGITDNYAKISFTVPAGQNRLNASIAYQGTTTAPSARVRMDLVDPSGRLASYSLPQGVGNYGNGQVANPQAGTWTAYITSRDSADGGTEGDVQFSASVAKFASFGSVSPSSVTLPAGKSATVKVTTKASALPGDSAGSLVLASDVAEAGVPSVTSVPITVRALIPTGRNRFTDTLTGGNGRAVYTGQTFYYGIQIPKGQPELNASVTLAANPTNTFYAYLVSPSGNVMATGANQTLTSATGGTQPVGKYTLGAQVHALAPVAGRWTVIVVFAGQVSGTAIREHFSVATDQSAVPVSATGLPTSTKTAIKAGDTKTVYVTVKNTGSSPEAFFIDPRLKTVTTQQIQPLSDPSTVVPLQNGKDGAAIPVYLVPTRTTILGAFARTDGAADIQFDTSAPTGDPDLLSDIGKSVSTVYREPRGITPGPWAIAPAQVGPFTDAATTEGVDTAMLAQFQKFDPGIRSATGDLWKSSVDPAATLNTITVGPGKTARIPVTIRPTGGARVVRGTIYVDDADLFQVYGDVAPNGNEVAALPYVYSVK